MKRLRRQRGLQNDGYALPFFFEIEKRKKKVINALTMLVMALTNTIISHPTRRTITRHARNTGWSDLVWSTYDEHRFKETFRVTRATFMYILQNICPALEKQMHVEEPIFPESRLAVCLYRLGRGDYLYTISELTVLGNSTVCMIVIEVCNEIIKQLWVSAVGKLFPTTENDFKEAIIDMEQLWQFSYAFAAIDGCHLPIKCPPGGRESNKEYHNFKEFYSIVLMALVDAKYCFIWANCGMAGNTHDDFPVNPSL